MDKIKIVVDTREKKIIDIINEDKELLSHCSFTNLIVGDFHIFYCGQLIQIIERKTISDLARSIIDKRSTSQKFRLIKYCLEQNLQIEKVSFLIEGFFARKDTFSNKLELFNQNEKISGIYYKALQQYLTNLETRDGFNIIHTLDQFGTYNYLKQKINCLLKYGFHIVESKDEQSNKEEGKNKENETKAKEGDSNRDSKGKTEIGGDSKRDSKEGKDKMSNVEESFIQQSSLEKKDLITLEKNQMNKMKEFILSNVNIDKKSNITPLICFYNQLAVIPGISIIKAKKIADYYGNLPLLIDSLRKQENMKVYSLGKTLSKRVCDYIFQNIDEPKADKPKEEGKAESETETEEPKAESKIEDLKE